MVEVLLRPRKTYSTGYVSHRETSIKLAIEGKEGGPISVGFSIGDMALVLGATIAGTVGSYALLTWLAWVMMP